MSVSAHTRKKPQKHQARQLSPEEQLRYMLERAESSIHKKSVFYPAEKGLPLFKEHIIPSLLLLYPYIDKQNREGFVRGILCTEPQYPIPAGKEHERLGRFCLELSQQFLYHVRNSEGNLACRFQEGHLENSLKSAIKAMDNIHKQY